MDPKMDSGFVPEGDPFEPEFDITAALSPTQVVWIMDEIFRLEALLYDGYPLSQTMFTSVHIFRLVDFENDYPYTFQADHTAVGESELVHTGKCGIVGYTYTDHIKRYTWAHAARLH